MSKLNLDRDEHSILDAFEADEFESDLSDNSKVLLADTAEANLKKDKRINIRLSRKRSE